jgi:hypothetical protein
MKKTLFIALAISISSFVSTAADGEKKPEAPRRENLLEKYDKNKNGKLDPDEREAVRKDREAERIKRFDKNGDGKLDEKEQEAARSEFRKRRGQDAPAKQEKKQDAPAPAK